MRIRTLAPAATLTLGVLLASAAVAPASAAPDGVHRIGGDDRFAVSAAISANTFGAVTSVPVAYVVSGENFADALSASALAGMRSGPVLLTRKDALPEAVRAELARVHPMKIIVLGGTASISEATFGQILPLAPAVERIGGADRFEVSAAAAHDAFPTAPLPVSFVASGENFPDALSGAAAAGHRGGPVLLVRKSVISPAVLDELDREKPAALAVLGGPQAIDDTVFDTLGTQIQSEIIRIGGKDRFEVSATTSASTFAAASTVYIASGENFPDALSGAAAAIVKEAPVLLVTKSSIPDPIKAELTRLKPSSIVILGGTAAIDASVEAQLKGFLKP
ncbi:cell wall-binding repeat-containing protein [Herbiconiux sp. VKM Ac-2851]|uniref:cell wall-binding repeat-containing protein n=1 Tax=Herbiconiux sp. VKM Ac-2851 TaxID=2739025 RepID=UPI001566D408|nr:cell wall-binding repeat-containing protein [Herbiconiux sp. VKM Ac-2851]NQX35222.1 cell wall-binding repeat-containing protein [Herbiconiux sp. VKM Ac-2851]